MPNREKVIKGLETIKQFFGYGLPSTAEMFDSYYGILNDALALLKEQEAVEPKLIKMYPHDIYECGNCKHRSVGSKDYKAKYCPECGRAVKWDD